MKASAFVVLSALVLMFVAAPDASAQCYTVPYYSTPSYYYSVPPSYYYTTPAPSTSSYYKASDTERIHYNGDVYSKKYITAVLDDGRKITVPVINGYMPSIDLVKMTDGSCQRNYYYDGCFKHNGETCVNYSIGGKGSNYNKKTTAPAPRVTESYDDIPYSKKAGISESSSFDRPPIITESRSFDYPKPKVGESVTPGPVEDKLPLKKIEMPQPDPEVKALKESVSSLQDSIRELKELVKQQQAELAKQKTAPAPVVAPEPRKIEAPSPMKKPSEFDKEPKK